MWSCSAGFSVSLPEIPISFSARLGVRGLVRPLFFINLALLAATQALQ
jgi:hypothetical protein